MNINTLIFIIVFFIITSTFVFAYMLNLKAFIIKNKEKRIREVFKNRSNLIYGLYHVTKKYSDKSDMIFKNILEYKKIELFGVENSSIIEFIKLQSKIHYELSFVIKFINVIEKTKKDEKLTVIKDEINKVSLEIWDELNDYKKLIKDYNKILKYKKYTILWNLIPTKEFLEI